MSEVTQIKPVTKRDLAERGVDALREGPASLTRISQAAGGVAFASALEVMEFAKLMAVAEKAVPKHLRNNPGACLRIVFQAVEWQMSPWSVADKSYEVNDRIAYESQLIHAVIEARAPLQHRLDCDYAGEGEARTCTVTGHFTTGDTRSYTSPPLGKIRKNSPLWKDDPDQQLFYFASRSWARKWAPDVVMGLYTKEELRESPMLGRPDDEPAGLRARLADAEPSRLEGHREGHVEAELEQIAAPGQAREPEAAQERPRRRRKGKAGSQEPEPEKNDPEPPQAQSTAEEAKPRLGAMKTAAEYVAYATAWISEETMVEEIERRWKAEMNLRNGCGVTAEDRGPLMEQIAKRREELS